MFERWRMTVVTSLVGLSIPAMCGIWKVVTDGGDPRHPVTSTGDGIVAGVYFGGSVLALLLGDLLAHPDDPIHTWNAVLWYLGGLCSWAVVGGLIGYVSDVTRHHSLGDESESTSASGTPSSKPVGSK